MSPQVGVRLRLKGGRLVSQAQMALARNAQGVITMQRQSIVRIPVAVSTGILHPMAKMLPEG